MGKNIQFEDGDEFDIEDAEDLMEEVNEEDLANWVEDDQLERINKRKVKDLKIKGL